NRYIAPAIQIAAFIQMLLVLPICLLAGIRGYRPGYIVFAASSVWIVGALLITLRNLGIVQPSWLTDYGFQLGSALEVILLALAQAERISIIKKEHAKAQEQLLAISQRTEQELDAEVRQRTSELADAVTRLQKLDKEKNEFLGIAAHDLKNPLTGIIGMSALLQKIHATLSEEQQSDYLQRISKNGQRMMHIISNLLDVNALETGQPHIRLEAIDLGQAARDVIQHYQETLAAKDLQLEVAVQEHILIRADQNTTIQLLDNLISNAIKYSPLGKHIWLSVSRHDNFGQFSIRDEGPGLSRQDQEHLFEKFVRLSSLPTAGEHSSGLGLFIVKKLSEALGGGVRCDSVPGQGCTFTVDIPLANAD
ncbi:MAG: HAMP domain-containing histidine kinase, partial [Burkholderiales bacterium]|nr:HAMP domain-containing histidine kinase [Burkholderiales bacterium]